jgi:hypothetical protein
MAISWKDYAEEGANIIAKENEKKEQEKDKIRNGLNPKKILVVITKNLTNYFAGKKPIGVGITVNSEFEENRWARSLHFKVNISDLNCSRLWYQIYIRAGAIDPICINDEYYMSTQYILSYRICLYGKKRSLFSRLIGSDQEISKDNLSTINIKNMTEATIIDTFTEQLLKIIENIIAIY